MGGFKHGNLNIDPGIYGEKIFTLLKQKKFEDFFNNVTGDNLNEYKIRIGGNLNLPKSKNQFFHTDGEREPRMIVVNIATSDVNYSNGPMEIYEKSHKTNYPYWKFHFINKFFMNKKKVILNYGDILIREHRMWHRGTSNSSLISREMMGIMFMKNSSKMYFVQDNISNEVKLHTNIFQLTAKGRLKEILFLYFRPILFLYKCLISIKKKHQLFLIIYTIER